MAFQQNLTDIAAHQTVVEVTFSPAFTSAPDIVIPVVQNTSADDPKLSINAIVSEITNEGFTVLLDGDPDTANYKLAWIAGSTAILFQVTAVLARRISDLNPLNTEPLDGDYFPIVHTSPVPVTRRLPWSVVKALFARFKSTPPAAPTDAGSAGQISLDANFLYTHDGTLWGRTERQTSGWGFPSSQTPVLEGRIQLVMGQKYIPVVYPAEFAFPGNVTFSFENTANGNKSILQGILTANTAAGFTVSFNTAPDSTSYYLNWRSKQRSA